MSVPAPAPAAPTSAPATPAAAPGDVKPIAPAPASGAPAAAPKAAAQAPPPADAKDVKAGAAATDTKPDPKAPAPDPASPAGKKAEGEPKPAGDAPAALKLPEGSMLAEADLEDIRSYAKEKGLTPEQATDLMLREDLAVKSHHDRQTRQYAELVDSWATSCKNHPEFGKEKFQESSEHSKRWLERYAKPSLRDALNKTGYGNFEPLWEALVAAGRDMADDKVPARGGPSPVKLSDAEVFFGKDGKR